MCTRKAAASEMPIPLRICSLRLRVCVHVHRCFSCAFAGQRCVLLLMRGFLSFFFPRLNLAHAKILPCSVRSGIAFVAVPGFPRKTQAMKTARTHTPEAQKEMTAPMDTWRFGNFHPVDTT